MKTAQRLFGLLVGLFLVILSVGPVSAAQLENFNISLSDTRIGFNGTYTFTFDWGSTGAIEQINFEFCKTPSGSCQPGGNQTVDTTTSTKGAAAWQNITKTQWDLDASTSARTPKLINNQGGESVTDGNTAIISLSTIQNNQALTECQASITSTDTCYVRVTTFSDLGITTIDTGVASYTLVDDIVISARVDPSFTFTINSVAANFITPTTLITTSEASTFNTLPFSNITANTPKYVAHRLNVTTNTAGGYVIYNRLAQQMTGVYAGNEIDPFPAAVGAPTTWTEPTGTASNVETGWVGYNTTDADAYGGLYTAGAGLFGALVHTGSTNGIVMQDADSDPGTSAVYVTYGLEANVFQPADTYTGSLMYIALPTY